MKKSFVAIELPWLAAVVAFPAAAAAAAGAAAAAAARSPINVKAPKPCGDFVRLWGSRTLGTKGQGKERERMRVKEREREASAGLWAFVTSTNLDGHFRCGREKNEGQEHHFYAAAMRL